MEIGSAFSSDAGPNRQTDKETKRNSKNVIFVSSALNYTCWYDLFLKNRKLQEILLTFIITLAVPAASLALNLTKKRFITL